MIVHDASLAVTVWCKDKWHLGTLSSVLQVYVALKGSIVAVARATLPNLSSEGYVLMCNYHDRIGNIH